MKPITSAAVFMRDNLTDRVARMGVRRNGKLFYRSVGGILYELDEAEVAVLDKYQFRPRLTPELAGTPSPPKRETAALQPNPSAVDAEAWGKLCKLTFAVQHNPNCPSPWLVRLPGKGPIDMKPYGDPLRLVARQTGDILGFGKTFLDATRAALSAKEASDANS